MKTKIITLALLVTSVIATSCGKKVDPVSSANGTISLALNANTDEIVIESKGANSGATKADELNVNAFKVNIKNPDGSVFKAWNAYSEVEETVALDAGTYLVEAYNAELQNAAFDAPYFYASQEVKVLAQAVQNIALECKLANTKVTVVFTEKFKNFIKDASVGVMNGENGAILTWVPSETRAGYFKSPTVGNRRLAVSASGVNKETGKVINTYIPIDNVAPQQWHKITVDIITSGSVDSEIKINTELQEKNITVEIPDADGIIDNNGDKGSWGEEPETPTEPDPTPDPEPAAAPTIVAANFDGAPFDIKKPVVISAKAAEGKQLDIVFNSSTGITKLLLKITSEVEMLAGMFPEEMDLANPVEAADWYGIFADPSLGIINPATPILGKKSHTFSVGGLMNMLAALGEDVNHSFKVTVVDANGQASETLVINIVK